MAESVWLGVGVENPTGGRLICMPRRLVVVVGGQISG